MQNVIDDIDQAVESGLADDLGSDDYGTLYMIHGLDDFAAYVTDDDEVYTTTDWQGEQPQSIDEMANFSFIRLEDLIEEEQEYDRAHGLR